MPFLEIFQFYDATSEVELSVASSLNYDAVIIGPPAHAACTPVSRHTHSQLNYPIEAPSQDYMA